MRWKTMEVLEGAKAPLFRRRRTMRDLENLRRNTAAFAGHKGKLLHGQRTKPMCDMYYGTHDLGYNGCELIAVANVTTMLGRSVPLPQVIYEFERNNMQYIFSSGLWGTSPRALRAFFEPHGFSFQSFGNGKRFDLAAAEKDCCGIISFWNNRWSEVRFGRLDFFSGGLHTVAFRRSGGKFYVYNFYSRDASPRVFDRISEAYDQKRFIVGYILEVRG